jgi:hypothetical protein
MGLEDLEDKLNLIFPFFENIKCRAQLNHRATSL